jgi:hypothetical protein
MCLIVPYLLGPAASGASHYNEFPARCPGLTEGVSFFSVLASFSY